MKKTIKEADKKESPNYGSNDLEDIQPTGDVEQDFNNAMVALRDDNYEAFVKDLNTLASDPKIEFLRDAIIDQFNSPSGVKVFFSKNQPLSIGSMHPTQHEVDMEKSLEFPLKTRPEMIDMAFSGKPISIKNLPLVVAEVDGTYYIIDGHHRWSQIYCLNPHAQMVVRVIKSDMFKNADDVLKLVQMQLFIAKDGGKLPQATVDSPYNLYTIDEKAFREWCQKTMVDEARQKFAQYIKDKNPIDFMWDNVTTMREYAEPTPNAHGRGDMPQTDKVEGEFMKPTAAPVSESKRGNTTMKRTRKTMESSKTNWFDVPDDDLEEYDESWEGRGLEEQVQDMPDRVDELASQIEDIWISLEDEGADVDKIMQLIQNYVELSKIDPEEVNMMLGG